MKFLTSLFFTISMILMVSCGGDSKKSSSSSVSAFRMSTFNAYYTPTKQYQVYYGGKWYSMQPAYSQTSASQLQQIQSTTANAIMSGASQYPMQVLKIGTSYVTVFRVKVVGMIGGGYTQQQYPQQYPQQGVSTGAGMIAVQSVQLY